MLRAIRPPPAGRASDATGWLLVSAAAAAGALRGLRTSWPTSHPRRSASCAPSVSGSRTAATRRRSRRTSVAWRPLSPAVTTRSPTRSTAQLVRDDRQGRQARRAAPQHRRAQEVPRRPRPRRLSPAATRVARDRGDRPQCRGVLGQLAAAARVSAPGRPAPRARGAACRRPGARLRDAAVGRPGRIALHRPLHLGGRLPRLEALGDGQDVTDAPCHERHEARHRLALGAQLQERDRRAAPSPPTSASTRDQT